MMSKSLYIGPGLGGRCGQRGQSGVGRIPCFLAVNLAVRRMELAFEVERRELLPDRTPGADLVCLVVEACGRGGQADTTPC